jgi:small subunit ribosomal protein S16
LVNPHSIELKEDRINYWLDHGAQPTNSVKSLLNQKGINLKRDLVKRKFTEDKIEAELKTWQGKKEISVKKKSEKKKVSAKQKAKAEKPAVEKKPAAEETPAS